MKKGYLTVFLAMSLGFLTAFILMLTAGAVYNAEKLRLECAADTGMNAVLSEFHRGLYDRYGLLYVDALPKALLLRSLFHLKSWEALWLKALP